MAKRRYKVLMERNLITLWDKVNDAIHEGWEPLGGATQVVQENPDLSEHREYMQTVWLPPQKKTSWWRK